MKRFLFVLFCLFLTPFICLAQPELENNDEYDNKLNIEFGRISFLNVVEASYQTNIISVAGKQFSGIMNFRLEDELTNDETYVLLQDVTFLDIEFNYTLGDFQIGLFLENLLGFNDSGYAIEPVLDNENGVDMVYFSHAPNSFVGMSITYNF